MKNLILPFVVVAVFAIGSCSDDTAINSPVDKAKDTTKNQDTLPEQSYRPNFIRMDGTGLAAMFIQSWTPPQYPDVTVKDTIIGSADFFTAIQNDTSLQIKNNIHIPGGDTIQLIDDCGYDSPENYWIEKVLVILDSQNKKIKYFSYKRVLRSKESKYIDMYNSESNSRSDSLSFTLENIPYTISSDSLVSVINKSDISNFLAGFTKISEVSSTKYKHHNTEFESRGTYFKYFLPLTEESKIRIVLHHR